jgi:hypothetical protein
MSPTITPIRQKDWGTGKWDRGFATTENAENAEVRQKDGGKKTRKELTAEDAKAAEMTETKVVAGAVDCGDSRVLP